MNLPAEEQPPAIVTGVEWGIFLRWFADVWHPGQHVAIIGPTGGGKTNLAVQIMALRRYVLALDAKGGDSTLLLSGYQRIPDWPPRPRYWWQRNHIREGIAEGKPARLIVGKVPERMDDFPALFRTLKKTMEGAFAEGGWTVYCDELQLMADMGSLDKEVERLLIAARDRNISVVTSYQAPAWVPTAASRQAVWIILYRTRDRDVIDKLARIIGRPTEEVEEALRAIPDWYVIVAGRDPFAPLVISHAPRLG